MGSLEALEAIVLVAVALCLLALLRAVLRREADQRVRQLLIAGVAAKITGAVVFYRVLNDFYGTGDSNRYFRVGSELASIIRSGSLPDQARETGTPFMEFLAGVVIAGTGPSLASVYAVFSLLSFTGLVLFTLAFKLTVPEGDHRRYTALVLLLPTIVFWTSNVSKEAWLLFCLGLGTYGVARLLRGSLSALGLAAAGVAGVFAIRPHMAALFALSFAVAYLVRVRDRTAKWGRAGWMFGLILVLAGSGYVASIYGQAMNVGTDSDSSAVARFFDGTDELLAQTDRQTQRGESEFDSRPVENPVDFMHALVTVPFRPFPHEAHNATAQIASLEGLLLLGLVVLAVPRLRRLPRLLMRYPFVAGAFVYSIGFIIAFSNVSNFGLLTRQRSQLLPFLVVLLALPHVEGRRRPRSKSPLLVQEPGHEPSPSTALQSPEPVRTSADGTEPHAGGTSAVHRQASEAGEPDRS